MNTEAQTGSASLPFGRVLRMGATGLDVSAVKIGLRRAGYGKGVKRGRRFGHGMRDALKHFQHAHGLHADGVYGRKTHNKLRVHFNKYATRIYRKSGATEDVTKLSARAAALRLEHYYHEHRYVPDRYQDYQDILATGEGRKVRNAIGLYVSVDKRVLQALCYLIQKGHRIGTFAICSDHHYDGTKGHAGGHAVDISTIDGVSVATRSAQSHANVLEIAQLLQHGMPASLRPWQEICDGYGYEHDSAIAACTIPGAWFYGAAQMSEHRNHIHLGYL